MQPVLRNIPLGRWQQSVWITAPVLTGKGLYSMYICVCIYIYILRSCGFATCFYIHDRMFGSLEKNIIKRLAPKNESDAGHVE